MALRLDSLPRLREGGTRLVEIASILLRHGFAKRLEKIEPDFVKRWLKHEDVAELALLPVGERARLACEELGPTFVKIGQVLSTRPDITSPEIAAELSKLQSNTPANSIEEIRPVIEESLGAPLEELFARFDPKPLASASIGQVHLARLHGGEEVVVKVRHPGIEERIQKDCDIIIALLEFLDEHDDRLRGFQLSQVADEVRRTLMSELDFRTEMRHMERFRRLFASNPKVAIPEAYVDLSSGAVLTMEHIPGYSIAERERLVADGHDRARLAEDGAYLFLEMVFREGAFHADPHPGNVLVLPDGRIGLIDFGMVAYLGDGLRERLIDVLTFFVGGDDRDLERAVEELTEVPKTTDRSTLQRDLADFRSQFVGVPMERLSATKVLGEFTALLRRHKILLPPPISMLIKVLVMLEGTARSLDRSVSILELIQPYCEELLQERHGVRASAKRAARMTGEWVRVAERLPGILDDMARRLERGELEVDLVHSGLETTVNRLVSGILCAAMLLGGAILWALKAPPVIFGVPVVGILASSLAFFHGLKLLYQLRSKP